MNPSPVTRNCGCNGKHLCPKAQGLRSRVNETLNRTFAEDEYAAWRSHRRAIREFKQHVRPTKKGESNGE